MHTLLTDLDAAADATLARTRDRLAALVDAIDGIVWEADPATFRFTYVSAQAVPLLGHAVEDWYREGFWPEHIHPDDREWAVRFCAGRTAAGEDHRFEYRMLAADGRTVWLRDAVTVRTDADGRPVALCGIMVDITREREARQHALETLHFLRQLGDAIPAPIFWKDADGRYRGCNTAFERYVGIDRQALDGLTVHDVAPPHLAHLYEAADNALFASGGSQHYEASVRYHDGSEHHVSFSKAAITRQDGTPGGLVGVMLDITERKRAEDALRLAGKVFEHSTQAILITDAQQKILKVNRSFSAITGYAEEEVLGRTPALLQSGLQDDHFYRAMWRTLHEQGTWSGELWNRRKCGAVYAEHLAITAVRDEQGAVANYIGVFSDISHYKEAQLQIERLSSFDGMTGLPNRAMLMDGLRKALERCAAGEGVAVLVVDLDRLAHVNDTLGHEFGDLLLIETARRLQAILPPGDMLARHIGDEFAVTVVGEPDQDSVARLAGRLLEVLSAPFVLGGHEVSVSASVGISMLAREGMSPETLLRQADVALHHAKAEAGGRTRFYDSAMDDANNERLQLESALRQALARGELSVHYQPQVDLGTGRITGMEALVRWTHPLMGMVSPARFIPVAERIGLIGAIGRWVLLEACRQTRALHDRGHAGLRVAVNVSAHQFDDDGFADGVRAILRETGLDPRCLELELTESMIMQQPQRVIAVMNELRGAGVQFSIDDFGTGYSSLAQLNRFPIDKLKIDQSFTREIGAGGGGAAIAQAIIALGRTLRLKIIAEGVETPAQRDFLAASGCDGMQGYLVSRPVPAVQFESLLAAARPA